MKEEPVITDKMMKCVKIHQSHVDKKVFNNPNTEAPRGAPRGQ